MAAHPYYGHAKRAGTTNAVGHAGFAVAADANVCMDPASDVAAQICNDFLPLLKALGKFYRD